MTPDPYKALRTQTRAIHDHDKERQQLIQQRNTLIRQLHQAGYPKRQIALQAGLSRETIYNILKQTT